MSNVTKVLLIISGILLAVIIVVSLYLNLTPSGRTLINSWKAGLKKADDNSLYETQKYVEDTARAMIATYKRNKLEYDSAIKTFKETGDEYYRQIADGYRQQANNTATTYNEYLLKNSYIWKGNIPSDIYMTLDPIT